MSLKFTLYIFCFLSFRFLLYQVIKKIESKKITKETERHIGHASEFMPIRIQTTVTLFSSFKNFMTGFILFHMNCILFCLISF